MTEEPAAEDALPRGWVPLGRYNWATSLAAFSSLTLMIGLISAFQIGSFIARRAAPGMGTIPRAGLAVGLGAVVAFVVIGVAVVVQRRRSSRPFVNFDLGEVRAGKFTAHMSELDRAELIVAGSTAGRWGSAILAIRGGPIRLAFTLRNKRGAISPALSHLLRAVLERSSVAMPKSKDDPEGRFARYNFPTNISREQAVELVTNVPEPNDDLPIPGWSGHSRYVR